ARHPGVVASLTAILNASWSDTYPRTPYGLGIQVVTPLQPGQNTVTVTFANGTAAALAITALRLEADSPQVQIKPLSRPRYGPVPVGATTGGTWQVTLPTDVSPGSAPWSLTATAIATNGRTTLRFT